MSVATIKSASAVATMFFAAAVMAESSPPTDTTIDPANLLALAQADWNTDGRKDKALLLISPTDRTRTELRIYLSDDSKSGFTLASRHQNIAWRGDTPASQPLLTVGGSGLVLRSGNGQNTSSRWHQVLSISYQNANFVVSRYSMTLHDKQSAQSGYRCDLNLLTRSGIRNTSSLRAVPAAVSVAQWDDQIIPPQCRSVPGQ